MNERSVFLEALEHTDPADRAAFLDRACSGQPDLRRGVEGLLAANARSGSFLRHPAGGDATNDHRPSEGPGSRVGPYKLLQEIGEGGMGVVYMAEQEHPVRRKVALKIIKPGMDSKQVVARFEAERQALGMMDHPCIAKVFDAGTTESGRPFFVMELVHGVPITEYCDSNKLTPQERLELFVPVCQAIQHAHMKGIIHRDVKPSNVLVTMYDDKPVPKVIDFGVAKAVEQRLTEKTLFTQYGALVGTFEYMSPEQAEMNAFGVDTRSDVYSLGVLLYELLTGTTPLERQRLRTAAFGEVVRLIKEEEPPRPSLRISSSGTLAKVAAARKTEPGKLSGLVRGELDWIVMRCLEKDRTRRYDTAVGLAKDVERYLGGDAVEACPPTLGYRLKKAFHKNRAAVRVASAFVCLCLGAVAMGAVLAVRATKSESAALAERDEKEQARLAEAEQRAAAVAAVDAATAANEKLRLAQDRATRLLYVSQINHASSALADNRLRQLQQILSEATPAPGEPDLRGWEWHYLDRLLRTGTEYKLDFGSGSRTREFRSWNHVTDDGRWAVRGRQEGDGVVFDVLDTPTGKSVGRVPKTGTLPDISKGNKDLWHFPVVSTDGRYLMLTEAMYHKQKPTSRITRRPRIWEVATGTEVAAPPDPLPREMDALFGTTVVGPGAEWVTWLDESPTATLSGEPGPADVTIRRWERAAGLMPPKKVTVGSGWGRLGLGPDGRTLFWSPLNPNGIAGPRPEPKEGPYRVEVWDIAAEPKLRWSVETPRPSNFPGYQPRWYTVLSPSRTSVAVLGADDIAVHSVADGKLLWRTAMPEKRPRTSDVSYRLSDDGDRIVCTWSQTITVLDRRTAGQRVRPALGRPNRADGGTADVRQVLFRNRFIDDPPPVQQARGGGRDESLAFHLLPDGKTLVGHDGRRDTVRVWDISPPETTQSGRTGVQFDIVDGQNGSSVRSADGRLTAKWQNREPSLSLLDAAGRGYGRIELPADGDKPLAVQRAEFLDAGRRLLVTTTQPAEQGALKLPWSVSPRQWILFDIENADRFMKVAEGIGYGTPISNSRYFQSTENASSVRFGTTAGSMHSAGYVEIREARTGRVVFESRPKLPAAVVTPTPESFDPTGERVVLISGKANEQRRTGVFADPATYVDPERIDVVETATGKRLWGIDLTAEGGTNKPGMARFSPDGRHVLVLGTNTQRESALTVYAAADGARLWTADGYARGPTSGTQIIGFAPDGRFVVIGDGDAAEVRDLQSGKRVHRLSGHLDTPDAAVFTPDNSRLFVSFRWTSSARQAQPRLHVWDLTTGRELLTLPSIQQLERYENGKLYGASGVLDGTPLKP